MAHDEHEHPNPNPVDDPRTQPMVLGAVLGTILVVVTVYAVMALYYRSEVSYQRQTTYDPAWVTAPRLASDQQAAMNAYRWTNKDKGTVGVPFFDGAGQVRDEVADASVKDLLAKQTRGETQPALREPR